MVSIKELRKICQTPTDCHKPTSIIEERIPRTISIYITKLLIYTPLTADHVTMLMVVWGFIVGFFFSLGTYWYMLAGALLLEFIPVLDCIDGELARYKKISSLRGVFLDPIAHIAHTTVPFIGLTIGLYKSNPSIYVVLLGLTASTFSVLCLTVQPLKHHVLVKEIVNLADKIRQTKSTKIPQKMIKEATKKNLLKSIGKTVNYLYHSFYMIYIFILAAIFNKLHWVLFFYGITFPLMWLAKLIREYRVGYKPYEYLFEPYKK